MGAHVLVVDDDPQILRMLTEVLTKRGFGVDVAHDGEEAYGRAIQRPPDLLVTDVMMPKLDGWSLVRRLRLEPKLANLPVIFLTAVTTDDARVQAFRLGADDYVNKPFKFNDLVGRIEKVLGSKRPQAKQEKSSGLAGDLAQVGLSTLLVLVEMERKNGVMSLNAADGRSGKISARDGKVIDASLDGAKQPRGAEAVYVMLTWTAGKFEFAAGKVDGEDTIKQSTTHLLMEGARLMDEASAPAAEEQLDEDAIAEWGVDEPTPMVAAAKLADLVRRSARNSQPPYAGHALSPAEREALAATGATPATSTQELVKKAAAAAATPPSAAAIAPVAPVAPPRSAPVLSPPVTPAAPPARTPSGSTPPSTSATGMPAKTRKGKTPSAPSIAAALEAVAEHGVDDDDEPDKPAEKPAVEKPVERPAAEKPAVVAKLAPPAVEARDDKPLRSSVERRRASALWLVGVFLAAGAGAATFAIQPKTGAPAGTTDLRADATALGAALDRSADSAQMRADGIAAMPMLRSGIETDAATLQDLVANEMMLKPAAGELIELYQVHSGEAASVLRMPSDGKAIAFPLGARVRVGAGKTVEVLATAPIKTQQGAEAGVIAVAVALNLDTVGTIATHEHGAKLTGLDQPIELAPAPGNATTATTSAPVPTKAAQGLALVANVPAAAQATVPSWLAPARYGAFALAGLLLIIYIALAMRAAAPRAV